MSFETSHTTGPDEARATSGQGAVNAPGECRSKEVAHGDHSDKQPPSKEMGCFRSEYVEVGADLPGGGDATADPLPMVFSCRRRTI